MFKSNMVKEGANRLTRARTPQSGGDSGSEPHPSLGDVVDAYQHKDSAFEAVRSRYSQSRGRILEEYYGRQLRNGVTLLENKLKRRPPEYKLEIEFESGSAHSIVDQFVRATRIEERRWHSVLSGTQLLVLERWFFSLLVSILSFADYNQGKDISDQDLDRRVKERVAAAQRELAAIGELAQKMARRTTLQRYLGGLPLGLIIVGVLGQTLTMYRYPIADTVANWTIMYCVTAGAVGAVISVMVRVTHGDNVVVDVDQGPWVTRFVGAFRPLIGAIFGAVMLVFIVAGLVPFAPPEGKDATLFFCGVAFLAGFSERWAQDTVLHSGSTLQSTQGGSAAPQEQPAS